MIYEQAPFSRYETCYTQIMRTTHPTSDPELNAVLQELVSSIQAALGSNFIGAYLQGSFAVGDWDIHSDVDYLVAIDHELSEEHLSALQAMHGRIFDLDSSWAKHLEGSYFPKQLLRRMDPAREALWYLDNGSRALIRSVHDNTLVVRWTVRECGVTLAGSHPQALIDPVSADDLRREVVETMHEWGDEIISGRYSIHNRWAQPFAVLSYCRMLHTLQTGRVESKPTGARWAIKALDSRWTDLIQRAWDERPNPSLKVHQEAGPKDVERTIEFIEYAINESSKLTSPET